MTMRSAHKLDPMPSMKNEQSWSPASGDLQRETGSETRIRTPQAVGDSDLLGSEGTSFTLAMTDALADILRFERRQG